MKKNYTTSLTKILFSIIFILGLAGSTLSSAFIGNAAAADSCTPPATTYGTDTMSFNVTASGTYTIWTRMQIPDTTDDYILMNVDNGKNCFNVGGYSIYFPVNTWTWIKYSDEDGYVSNTADLSAGTHTITLTGVDPGVSVDRIEVLADPNCTPTGTGDNCTPAPDTTPPTVSITSEPPSITNSTSASFAFSGNDNVDGANVSFNCGLDSNTLGSCDKGSASYTGLAQGTHSFTVEAVDSSGNVSTKDTYSWTIDTTPPTIAISAPSSGATISGTTTVAATTSGASSVQFKLDGQNLGTPDTTSPYSYSWNTAAASNGSHTLSAVATDAAGNTATSSNVTVNVDNSTAPTGDTTPPSVPANLSAGTPITSTTIPLTWNASTDNNGGSGMGGYKLYRNGALIATLGSTTTSYLDHAGLTNNTSYSYTVSAYDNAGNTSAQSSAANTKTSTYLGDVDGNGVVNIFDLNQLLIHYQTSYPQAEFDAASNVDIYDLTQVLINYGK
jgi:hypothetical protein